ADNPRFHIDRCVRKQIAGDTLDEPQRLALDFHRADARLQIWLRVVREARTLTCPSREADSTIVDHKLDAWRADLYDIDQSGDIGRIDDARKDLVRQLRRQQKLIGAEAKARHRFAYGRIEPVGVANAPKVLQSATIGRRLVDLARRWQVDAHPVVFRHC